MLILSTDSLGNYGLNRVFGFTKQADYDGIEIGVSNNYDTQNADYIQSLVDKYQIPVVAISAPKRASKTRILYILKMAKKLNCPLVILRSPELFSFKLTSWIKKELPVIAKKEKIKVCLENAPSETILGIIPKYAMNSPADLKKFKAASINTATVVGKKQNLVKIYDQLKKFVFHIHLGDATETKTELFPGTGVVPLESFLIKLRKDKYKHAISLRVKPKELSAGKDQKMLKKLKEVKKIYEKHFLRK